MGNSAAVQNSTLNVAVNNGLTFAAGVTSPVLGGLAGGGNIALQDAASNPVALIVGGNGANAFYAGALSGPGGLTKTGSGMFTIAAPQSYAGTTVIQNGTLQLCPSLPGFSGSNADGLDAESSGTGAAIASRAATWPR